MKLFRPAAFLVALVIGSRSAAGQQAIDSAYTARIRELTTNATLQALDPGR